MYVIAGVSGHTGSVVASMLLAAKQPVRVIVRDAAKGETWKARGAEVAVANLDDRASLAKALTGATGAYLLMPPSGWTETNIPADRARFAEAIVGAVRDARPGHVVLLSSIGAERQSGTGPIQYIHPIETGLRESGVPSTFLRAAFFQENWGAVAQGALDSGTLYYGIGVRIPQVATADIGTTAARLLQEGPKGTRIVNLAGPKDLTLDDVAAALGTVSGKSIKAVAVPSSAMVESLLGMGASRDVAAMYGEMAAAANEGRLAWDGDVTRGSTTLEHTLRGLLGR